MKMRKWQEKIVYANYPLASQLVNVYWLSKQTACDCRLTIARIIFCLLGGYIGRGEKINWGYSDKGNEAYVINVENI